MPNDPQNFLSYESQDKEDNEEFNANIAAEIDAKLPAMQHGPPPSSGFQYLHDTTGDGPIYGAIVSLKPLSLHLPATDTNPDISELTIRNSFESLNKEPSMTSNTLPRRRSRSRSFDLNINPLPLNEDGENEGFLKESGSQHDLPGRSLSSLSEASYPSSGRSFNDAPPSRGSIFSMPSSRIDLAPATDRTNSTGALKQFRSTSLSSASLNTAPPPTENSSYNTDMQRGSNYTSEPGPSNGDRSLGQRQSTVTSLGPHSQSSIPYNNPYYAQDFDATTDNPSTSHVDDFPVTNKTRVTTTGVLAHSSSQVTSPLHDTPMAGSDVDDIGPYVTITSQIACNISGRFCDLFEGWHVKKGRVAMKRPRLSNNIPDQKIKQSFRKEAETWKCLRHDHVLGFYGTCEKDGYFDLVSPFMENGTLWDYIHFNPLVDRVRLLLETASALAHLHACGIIHGDIKASNVLVSDKIRALLCDFGLSKYADAQTTTAQKGAGTVRWQAPELWVEESSSKTRESDVYAFGITIHETLSGQVPFAHILNDHAVVLAVLHKHVRPATEPAISPAGETYVYVWWLAQKCWSALIPSRPLMEEVHSELCRCVRSSSSTDATTIPAENSNRGTDESSEGHSNSPMDISRVDVRHAGLSQARRHVQTTNGRQIASYLSSIDEFQSSENLSLSTEKTDTSLEANPFFHTLQDQYFKVNNQPMELQKHRQSAQHITLVVMGVRRLYVTEAILIALQSVRRDLWRALSNVWLVSILIKTASVKMEKIVYLGMYAREVSLAPPTEGVNILSCIRPCTRCPILLKK